MIARQGHFEKIPKIVRKYKLLQQDKKYQSRVNYIPTISLIFEVARYREGIIQQNKLTSSMNKYCFPFLNKEHPNYAFQALKEELILLVPKVFKEFIDHCSKKCIEGMRYSLVD